MSTITLKSVLNELEKIKESKSTHTDTCNICSLELLSNDKIKLKCKHEYHYDCILNWYIKTVSSNNSNPSSSKIRECPYCRQVGGYLPMKLNTNYIKHIHAPKYSKFNKEDLNKMLKPKVKCKGITKTGNVCKLYAKEDGEYCHIHHKK